MTGGGKRITDYGLRITDYGLRITDYGLREPPVARNPKENITVHDEGGRPDDAPPRSAIQQLVIRNS
jgi:hypothetical protein